MPIKMYRVEWFIILFIIY